METLSFVWTYLKIIIEPSSAVALAPLFSGEFAAAGRRVGVIFSGGNVNTPDCGFLQSAHGSTLSAAGRVEKPGAAAGLGGRPRVLLTDDLGPAALAGLRRVAEVDERHGLSSEELVQVISAYEGLVVGPRQHVDSQVIDYGYRLRAIACATAEPDNIEMAAARDMGIEVLYVPGGNTVAIAEHTIARLLQLGGQFGSDGLAGKTLGLIGYGRVAQQVAQRAQAFEMTVLTNQPRLTPELAGAAGVEATDLIDLLRRADYVSLHVPFTAETEAILGAAELAQMKPEAFLVNTGHTDLVDEAALLRALRYGRLAGAALPALPVSVEDAPNYAAALRAHSRVIVTAHVTAIIDQQRPALEAAVIRDLIALLQQRDAGGALSLELVPVTQVVPHEATDEKRVTRLAERLLSEQQLVNPPVTTFWNGRYIVLDGATRFAALKRLGCREIIVQVVSPQHTGLELHTWYHAISHPGHNFQELLEELQLIPGLQLQSCSEKDLRMVLADRQTLACFIDRSGAITLAGHSGDRERLDVMNDLVDTYGRWGSVERTMLTDMARLQAHFPDLSAVAVFPQFAPAEVFEAASHGRFLPAGLTRFLIPGRILRLNADLQRLRQQEPLAEKKAWFSQFLAEKMARSRLRYYQEPVVLLDE